MSLTLTLKNFRCWEDKTITFPAEGICILSGRSGKGKSTIFNAFSFLITGKGKNITSFHKKTTSVTLSRGDTVITRTRGPNRLTLEREGVVYEDDEAQSIIDSIFGTEFCHTSYIDQDNTHSFVFLSPAEKMEFLETLLLHHFQIDEMKDKVKDAITKAKIDHSHFETRWNTLHQMKGGMTKRPQNPIVIDDKINVTSGNVHKLTEKIRTNLTISDKNSKTTSLKIKKGEQDLIHSTKMAEKRQQIQAILDDTILQLSLLGDKSEITTNVDLLCEKKKECINMRSYFRYMELETKVNEIRQKNEVERQKYIEMTAQLPSVTSIRESIKILNRANDIISSLILLDESIQDPPDFQDEIDKKVEMINNLKEKRDHAKSDLTNAKICYRCPSCEKNLKLLHNHLVIESVSKCSVDDQERLQKLISSLDDQIRSGERELDDWKTKKIQYETNNTEYNRLFDILESLLSLPTGDTIEQDAIDQTIETYAKYLSTHETASKGLQTIDGDRLFMEWKKELESFPKSIRDIKDIKDIKDTPEQNEEIYSTVVNDLSSAKEKLERIRSLTAKKDAYTKELGLCLAENETDILQHLSTEREKYELYQQKSENYRIYIQQLEEWVRIEKENDQYDTIEKNIAESKDQRDCVIDRLRGLVKLRDHIKQAEQKSMEEFISSLNQHASIYIEEFFPDDDLVVELKTEKDSGVNSKKEKIALHFDVKYRNMSGDLSFLSGGEKDRVNLAFTLAFSELVDTKILMLDECISSLDSETTNVVLEHMKEKYKGKLMIVVSHQANLGFFDHLIEL